MAAEIGLALLVSLGLTLFLAMFIARRGVLKTPPPPCTEFPPITILKPLKGIDPGLEENLRSIFRLDYPSIEVILGSPDHGDPALEIARRVAAEHPHIPSRVLVNEVATCFNPKVNLMAGLAHHATHELQLISDSNILVPPGYLRDLVSRIQQPDVGLVSSLFRGTEWQGLGGSLEALQLNTYVMGGVAAMHRLLGMPCVVGKSMLFRRGQLDRIGGFAFLGRHLAEDQVCGEAIKAAGLKVEVSGCVIDNVLGRRSMSTFLNRHLRWCRIRRHISLAGYLGEFLLNPVFFGVMGAAILRTPAAIGTGVAALALVSLLWAITERQLKIRRPLIAYPLLELARAFVTAGVWFVPFFSHSVNWRGDRLRIGRGTLLALDP